VEGGGSEREGIPSGGRARRAGRERDGELEESVKLSRRWSSPSSSEAAPLASAVALV
jgi:hypothetical protein